MKIQSARREPLTPHQMPAISSTSAAAGAAERLDEALAADQAEREQRIAAWECRRQQLVDSIETTRRRIGYGIGLGSGALLLGWGGLSLGVAADVVEVFPMVGVTAPLVWAGCLLVGLLLRTFISAVGEALGRNLIGAARREGVDLPEVRFD